MAIELDTIALGALLGYDPGETMSICDVRIEGESHIIEVSRFVANTHDPELRALTLDALEPAEQGVAVKVVDRFRYRAKPIPSPRPKPKYVALSKNAVKALQERQMLRVRKDEGTVNDIGKAVCPECGAGKHTKCDGTALNVERDEIVNCHCVCRLGKIRVVAATTPGATQASSQLTTQLADAHLATEDEGWTKIIATDEPTG